MSYDPYATSAAAADGGPPLRILSLYDCVAPGSVGGVEQRNLELASVLGARGHSVTLAGWAAAPDRPAPGVRVVPLRAPRPLYTRRRKRSAGAALLFAADAARIGLEEYDLVETANIPYLHLFPLAARCRRQGKPLCVIWYEHWGGYWREYLEGAAKAAWPLFAGIERAAGRLGTAVAASSHLTADRLARRRGRPVPVLPIGVPVAEIRAAAATPEPAPPLVYAGRFLPEKRLDLLLRALAIVRRQLPDRALLRLIGDGPDRPRLEALAEALGLGPAVELAGRLPTARDVWRHLGGARIAVQPSAREGYGLFPLEAMAAGLPVVHCASPESAVGELVRDGVEGVRTDPRPESLAEALEALLQPAGEERRARLAAAARERADELSWDVLGERAEAFYRRVLAGGTEG